MIRLFTLLLNLDPDKMRTAHSLLAAINNDFNIYKEHCPKCGAKGCLQYHDQYNHNLVEYNSGSVMEACVEIHRVCCLSCNETFAVLPDIFVPYKSYSILFIMTVLKAYFFKTESVRALCYRYGISVSTLYAWKKRYLTHKQLNLGKLEKYLYSEDTHLSGTCQICFTSLLYDFFIRYGFSFLQFTGAV